tara:strand:- start:205 stop:405 length:201 start_codon:yes stop_codon:yes gene_type:complete
MPEKILISLDQLKRMKLNTKELQLVDVLCDYYIVHELQIAKKNKTEPPNFTMVEKLKKRLEFLLDK